MSSSSDETPPNDLPNENQPVEQSTDPSIDLPADPPVQIPPAELPPHNQFVLPESLLKLETVEQALNAMLSATLWPILVHTPSGPMAAAHAVRSTKRARMVPRRQASIRSRRTGKPRSPVAMSCSISSRDSNSRRTSASCSASSHLGTTS
jgi:hypothetical protein